MTSEERKEIVRQLLGEGRTLSEVQDYLQKEKGDSITYMELRLLLSEIPDAQLPDKEFSKVTLPPEDAGSGSQGGGGKVHVSVDQVPQPGSMLSGYARFSSGAKGHWFLDSAGRLGVEPELGSEKPTQADMKEFSAELRRILEKAGGPA
jgi:hypothetical protein